MKQLYFNLESANQGNFLKFMEIDFGSYKVKYSPYEIKARLVIDEFPF